MESPRCPVCENELPYEPWDGKSASFEICHECGIHFGYNDAREDLRPHVYRRWREAWVANGRRALIGKEWNATAVMVAERALADAVK